MAPTADSVDLKGQKKAKKSNSKDERKHRKDKHDRPAADEASLRNEAKRKHKGGQEGKEHGKKPKKENKAGAEAEAMGAEVKRGEEKMKRAMEDERFAAARTDPRFRPMRRKEAKVALDSRFNGMLTDPMFASSEAPVDKRGRRRKKGAKENPMLHYYLKQEEGDEKEKVKLVQEDDDDEVEEEDEQVEEESSSSDDEEEEDDDENTLIPLTLSCLTPTSSHHRGRCTRSHALSCRLASRPPPAKPAGLQAACPSPSSLQAPSQELPNPLLPCCTVTMDVARSAVQPSCHLLASGRRCGLPARTCFLSIVPPCTLRA
ncbi:unnamed protein product [Triticum turgidum subsp. durum]|uniref:NUC153 domain-containing protein n=1 Tax=Triticum turgidum subsp. durum TaxID=4567 RepID=A0A9R1NQR7_TRITD|nr:unnamed protein product [Triticum turgidum subsp. durum]